MSDADIVGTRAATRSHHPRYGAPHLLCTSEASIHYTRGATVPLHSIGRSGLATIQVDCSALARSFTQLRKPPIATHSHRCISKEMCPLKLRSLPRAARALRFAAISSLAASIAACSGGTDSNNGSAVPLPGVSQPSLPGQTPSAASIQAAGQNAPGVIPSAVPGTIPPAVPGVIPPAVPGAIPPAVPVVAAPQNCETAKLGGRLLTPLQYDNSVTDLLGTPVSLAAETFGLGGLALDLSVLDNVAVTRFSTVAERAAASAMENPGNFFPCADATTAEDACVQQWVADFGARAYRRPLEQEELAAMQGALQAGVEARDLETGVEWLLTALLQSPGFVYRFADNAASSADQVNRLGDYEVASRLSYFLWNSMPDDTLFDAAAAGTLQDASSLASQATRMLEHPNFQRSLESFYGNFMGLRLFAEATREVDGFDGALIDSLRESVNIGLQKLYEQPEPSIDTWLTGTEYYMDARMAEFYGQPAPEGGEFVAVDLASEGRRGVFGHPALTTALARPNQANPISRGVFVLENLLCTELVVPDIDIPDLPPIEAGGTEREQVEAHVADPVCAACHALIDPLGFAFQDFDQAGRTREGFDSSGNLTAFGPEVDGPFTTGTELFERLGASQKVRECFAKQFFEFAVARHANPDADACSLQPIYEQFNLNGDLKQLIMNVVASPAFTNRLGERVESAQ